MKQALTLIFVAMALSSCATIATRSIYPVMINSEPSDAEVTIVNRAGSTVYTGNTPTIVRLKSAAGYMKKEEYQVTFRHPDCEPKTFTLFCTLDGWYIGNILVGGLIGMLIVDPASGAMYKLDKTDLDVDLQAKNNAMAELRIIDIDHAPKDAKLVKLN